MTSHVLDFLVLLALALPAALLFRRFRLPSMAGFLVVGALAGPHALGWIDRTEEVELLAEIGVVLLLFTIGLEFSLPRLLQRGRQLLISGGFQVVATVVLVCGIGRLLGLSWASAVLAGYLASLSSTAFVLKLLHDQGRIDAPEGRFTVGILLFQDLVVVLMLLSVPMLAGGAGTGTASVLLTLVEALGAILLLVLFGRYGFPRLARIVVRLGGRELFVLFIAFVTLGAAWVTESLGISVALGAFLAGLLISESEYSHQVVSEVLPFRDVFNAIFFVAVGMLLDVRTIVDHAVVVTAGVLSIMVLKAAVVVGIGLWLTRSLRVALLSGVALAQIGEFSFIVAQEGRAAGLLSEEAVQVFLAIAVLGLVLTPFTISAAPALLPASRAGAGRDPGREPEVPVVAIVGYGLNGRNLARVLAASSIPYRVLEIDPDIVVAARRQGVPIVFGDASRRETLRAVGVPGAAVLVLAISDPATTRRAVRLARDMAGADLHVIVRTRYVSERLELLRAGADEVVPEEFETSIEIFRRVLLHLEVPADGIAVQTSLVREEGYEVLREEGSGRTRAFADLPRLLAGTMVDTVQVPTDSPVVGRSLAELDVRERTGVLIVAVKRGAEVAPGPGGDFVIEGSDVLTAVGDREALEALRGILDGSDRD